MLADNPARVRIVDVAVNNCRLVLHGYFDCWLLVAESHATRLNNLDVMDIRLLELFDDGHEGVLRPSCNAACSHCNDDLASLLGLAKIHLLESLFLDAFQLF